MADKLENGIYIVQDGKTTKVTPKKFGEDTITWRDGKVWSVDRSEKVKVVGQEVI